MNDYSATTTAGFCSWSLLPASLQTGCRAADPVERNNGVPGQPLPGLGKARGVLLDPADINSLRAAYYNRYISEQNVSAIIRLLSKAKQVTGNRILTSTFYGYLYGLNVALPIGGHHALTSLLASSAVDIVAAPYSYSESRQLDNAFSPQGPSDSPQLANKLWVDEDDTRTEFACYPSCSLGGFQSATNLWDSIRVLRRNLLTAGIHGHGSYFLDLASPAQGWFGRTDMASDSDTLWANLTNAFTGVNKIQMGAGNRFGAQVAVFMDDLSDNYIAGLTPAGDYSYAFSVEDILLEDNLSHLGTPVKHYLLSDLLRSNLDLSAVKLAILPNAFNVPPNLRQAIDSKLKTPGRTVLFIYAAGYLSQDAAAAVSNINSFTGINVSLGSGTPLLSESFTVNGQSVPGGPSYPLTPWFTVTDAGASADGRYTMVGSPVSLGRKTIAVSGGSYTSILAAAPSLPLSVLRNISERAGVFHYIAAGDVVESSGNMMIVHAATTGYKTITFPLTMPRILETAIYPSDSLMCSNCNQLSQLPFNDGDTRAFRWTTPPSGNFDLLSGTTATGWAADLDMPDNSISVSVYMGGPMGVGTNIGTFVAAISRPDVNQFFGISGTYGFSISLGSCPSGTPVYIYALDPEGQNGDGSGFIGSKTCQ